MDKKIEELTLLLIYLTSWEEDGFSDSQSIRRSWKGYLFEMLDRLTEKGMISQSKKAKSVYLTEKGVKLAKSLGEKYNVNVEKVRK